MRTNLIIDKFVLISIQIVPLAKIKMVKFIKLSVNYCVHYTVRVLELAVFTPGITLEKNGHIWHSMHLRVNIFLTGNRKVLHSSG